ncbi:MAG: mandelate racemase/muconate lactonizing enzyme family protein [Candidatus Bathyarchaeia archaeon]
MKSADRLSIEGNLSFFIRSDKSHGTGVALRIAKFKTYALKGRHWPSFPWILVELQTDEGISGIGEGLPYKSGGLLESLETIGKLLIGEDPFNIEAIWESLYRAGIPPPTLSAIEIALWDIVGKALGQPVYRLLGGCCHERLRVYADGFFRGASFVEAEYSAKALSAVEEGFTALKMDVDEAIPKERFLSRSIKSKDINRIVSMVKTVKDAVGEDVDLAIDCHGAFNVSTAVELGKRLEDLGLMWIEDPVPSGNHKAMAKVSEALSTPVCTGELLSTRYEFRELLERQAADVIMPDVARAGGILETKKIATAADTYYVAFAPHNMVSPVATMASLQVSACTPNFLILEFQMGDVAWRDAIIDPPIPLERGYLKIPSRPGIGIELKKDELQKHLLGALP